MYTGIGFSLTSTVISIHHHISFCVLDMKENRAEAEFLLLSIDNCLSSCSRVVTTNDEMSAMYPRARVAPK